MENLKKQWTIDIASKHLKAEFFLLVVCGCTGIALSVDDFVGLGRQITGFIFPYAYNLICFSISVFLIFAAFAFKKRKNWSKIAVFCALALKIYLGVFDYAEMFIAGVPFLYLLYIMLPSKAGRLFKKA
ncbi:MAG: hypothetical protein HY810_10115 [Candidatus Omnitrophica bacterium]|nr:hypothetical protein [Candidatus Omnitrophota bacterium]